MIGGSELRKLINRANADHTGADPSHYWNKICDGIAKYFLRFIPGPTAASKAQADLMAKHAKDQLEALAIIKQAERQRINERGGYAAEIERAKAVLFGQPEGAPPTERHMVDNDDDYTSQISLNQNGDNWASAAPRQVNNDDETDDDDDEEVDPQVLRSLRQQQALLRAAQQPGVFLRQPQQQQRRQFQQYAQDPDDDQDVFGAQTQQQLTRMTSGVGRRQRLEDLEANSLYADEVDDDNFAVPRGGASGSKKRRGSKPKPKKRIATKSKGKKQVPKRKK
jgi:hypothetical protein